LYLQIFLLLFLSLLKYPSMKIKPTVTETPRAQPIFKEQAVHQGGMVRVRYKPKNTITLMDSVAAQRTVRNSPKNYEIVS
jgi:hypothetical protein